MANSTNTTSPAPTSPATNSSSSSSSNSTAAASATLPSSPPPSSPPTPPSSPPPSSPDSSPKTDKSTSISPPPPAKSSGSSSSSSLSSTSSSSDVSPPPPPSPPGALAPPPPKASDSPSSSSSVILGAAGGAFAVIVIVVIIASFCYCCKKKKKIHKPHDSMQYYNDTSGFQANNYFMSGPDSHWHQPDSTIGKPPLHPGKHGGGGRWQPQPPPPPPIIPSTDMSSGGFSGPHGPPLPPPSPTLALGFNNSTFTYEELASATNNFSQANLLGQGGFGYVHKGWLPNGKEIAVKQLKSGSGQGEREFQAEVDIISRVHHRHLVSLVGYCIAGVQRMLVYEYVPNKTLEYHLHGAAKGLPVMDWPTRLKISLGAAKGIAYLHEDCHPRIIHRDIKSSNILLDNKFEAMVADFGLAKLTNENHTHVSTRVMGTFGYLAPEYASSGKLTEKSDVFSYGVMLLELITGRRPVDMNTFMEDSLVDWARPVLSRALADGNYDELADPRLEGNYDTMEMARMVACGAACVRHSARRRPRMSQVVRALEGDVSLEDLNEGMRPGQSMMFSSGSEYESNSSYTSNMRKMRKMQLASPEYSGDYSGPITEYGRTSAASSVSDGEYSDELKPNPRLRDL